jgi:hypothetical protein
MELRQRQMRRSGFWGGHCRSVYGGPWGARRGFDGVEVRGRKILLFVNKKKQKNFFLHEARVSQPGGGWNKSFFGSFFSKKELLTFFLKKTIYNQGVV